MAGPCATDGPTVRGFLPPALPLYWDSFAYHLSMAYPSRMLGGTSWRGWYVRMVSVLCLLGALLAYGTATGRWGGVVAPTSVVAVLLVWWVWPVLTLSMERSRLWGGNRLDANGTARTAVDRGVERGTVLVEGDFFDLFVPPPSLLTDGDGLPWPSRRGGPSRSSSAELRYARVGLVLFPGALVESRAYGGVCRRLAEERGVMVVLFNTERLHRLPIEFLGCDRRNVSRAMSVVETRYRMRAHAWSIGGHSLGGHTAEELLLQARDTFRKIVLWGVYRELILGAASADVLVVQASNDAIGASYREGPLREAFLSSLTKVQGRSLCHNIEGGNHGGFGDYEPQIFPTQDGGRTISLDAMHSELVEVTASFLLDGEGGDKKDCDGQG